MLSLIASTSFWKCLDLQCYGFFLALLLAFAHAANGWSLSIFCKHFIFYHFKILQDEVLHHLPDQ